jgi:hypothetical protein
MGLFFGIRRGRQLREFAVRKGPLYVCVYVCVCVCKTTYSPFSLRSPPPSSNLAHSTRCTGVCCFTSARGFLSHIWAVPSHELAHSPPYLLLCVRVCLRGGTCMCTLTHTHDAYACTDIHIQRVCMFLHTYICVYLYVPNVFLMCSHMHVQTYIYTHASIHIYEHMQIHTYVCS